VVPKVVDAELAAASGGAQQTTSFNFAVLGMELWEMEHLQDEVLALRPARLQTIVMEPQFWRPHDVFLEDAFEARAVHWHTPALTRDVIEATLYINRPLPERLRMCWLHVKMLARNLTSYAQGPRMLASVRGEAPLFDYLLPSDLDGNHGYQDPSTTRDELEIADHERFGRTLKAYAEEVAQIEEQDRKISKWMRIENQPVHLLLDQVRKLEGLGLRVLCVVPPGLVPTPEMRMLHQRGLLKELLAFNIPSKYPQFYAPDRRYDRGHMNRKGAEEFSRLLADRMHDLTVAGTGH
jgi:hypothetical protein